MKLSQDTLAVGDVVTIGDDYGIPKEFRLRPAIVKEVHPTFVTVAVLTSNKRICKGELWPSYKSLLGPADRTLRLGARVRVVGLSGEEARTMNGACGRIVLDKAQNFHPLWANKFGKAVLTVAVVLDGHPNQYWIHPRYLEEEATTAAGPEVTEPTTSEPEAPVMSTNKNNMDVDATKVEPETTTATASAAEEWQAKGVLQQQQQQQEQEPMSRSTTATTATSSATANSNFEIPEWIVSFASKVDACVAEIKERQNQGNSGNDAQSKKIPFNRLPSVGTWLMSPGTATSSRSASASAAASVAPSTIVSTVQLIAPIAIDVEVAAFTHTPSRPTQAPAQRKPFSRRPLLEGVR